MHVGDPDINTHPGNVYFAKAQHAHLPDGVNFPDQPNVKELCRDPEDQRQRQSTDLGKEAAARVTVAFRLGSLGSFSPRHQPSWRTAISTDVVRGASLTRSSFPTTNAPVDPARS